MGLRNVASLTRPNRESACKYNPLRYRIAWPVKCTGRRGMKPFAVSLVLLSVTTTPLFAQLPEDLKRKFDQAERQVVRLPLTAFPELPRNVVRELQRRDCTIPQVAGFNKRQNVIHGEFGKPGQADWAVLCARAGFVELYVFWNGRERDMSRVGRWPLGDPFETAIAPVSRRYILDHYRAYGGPKPPPINHQGVECSSGMASSILYFYKGRWLTLQGAD